MSETAMEIPDVIRRAMEAAGVDAEQIAAEIEAGNLEPPERDLRPVDHGGQRGVKCASCGVDLTYADRGVLREIVGWSRPREQGGQNHVIGRRETGRMICGKCGTLHKAGLPAGQESLL